MAPHSGTTPELFCRGFFFPYDGLPEPTQLGWLTPSPSLTFFLQGHGRALSSLPAPCLGVWSHFARRINSLSHWSAGSEVSLCPSREPGTDLAGPQSPGEHVSPEPQP